MSAKWGFDPLKALGTVKGLVWVRSDRKEYERQRLAGNRPGEFPLGSPWPIWSDRNAQGGTASGQYFHQDLLVAREIYQRKPQRHIDVGSRIDGFVAHVATFREIEVVDIRPISSSVPGIIFVQRDVMDLDPTETAMTDSLSCLHALEHFGLGRYGDPVDYDGWRKGLAGLTQMLSPGGILYLGVPTGQSQRVEFNAHRVFSLPFLREVLKKDFDIERLAFIDDRGDLIESLDPHSDEAQLSFRADHGCSVWVLRRK